MTFVTLAAVAALSLNSGVEARPYRDRGSDSDSWGWFSGPRSNRSHDYDRDRPRRGKRTGGSSGAIPGVVAPKSVNAPEGPLFYIVSIGQQHVSVYGNDGLVARSPVSSGARGHDTPTGIFSVLERDLHHRSNIYSAAPMPYMQRITFSGVALHAGVLPGYAASHGCIRMPYDFAQKLWGMSKGRERVIVTPQDVTPLPFSHAKLPTPRLFSVPGASDMAASQVLRHAIDLTGQSKAGLQTANNTDSAVRIDAAGTAKPQFMNPIDFAKSMRLQTVAKIDAADSSIKSSKGAILSAAKEATLASIEQRRAEIAVYAAKLKVRLLETQLKTAKDDEAAKALAAQKNVADAALTDAQTRLSAAMNAKNEKAGVVAAAAGRTKDAETKKRELSDLSRSWSRRLEPVSIFISRKTRRLYIRQGYMRVFDVPVKIENPETPIGTHLYMAMQPKPTDADKEPNLAWLVVSMPEGEGVRERLKAGSKGKQEAPRAVAASSERAAKALDRIEFSPEVTEIVSEMLWTGASIIVSDNGLSDETANNGTDFVILTR